MGGAERRAEGFHVEPGPTTPQLQYSRHLVAHVMKPGKSGGWVEPDWKGQLPFPSRSTLPLLGSARYQRAYGWGAGGAKGTQVRKGLGAGRLRGRPGWEEGCLAAPVLPG